MPYQEETKEYAIVEIRAMIMQIIHHKNYANFTKLPQTFAYLIENIRIGM